MSPVIDASIALAWLFPDEEGATFQELLESANQEPPMVTGLWLYEVCNSLAIGVRRKRLEPAAAEEALDLLSAVPLNVVQLGWLDMRAAFRIASEHGLSVYDAAYLHLARYADRPLLTLDKQMKKAAASMGISTLAP